MSDMYFRFPIADSVEAYLVDAIFPYAGVYELDTNANDEVPSYRMRYNMGDYRDKVQTSRSAEA